MVAKYKQEYTCYKTKIIQFPGFIKYSFLSRTIAFFEFRYFVTIHFRKSAVKRFLQIGTSFLFFIRRQVYKRPVFIGVAVARVKA